MKVLFLDIDGVLNTGDNSCAHTFSKIESRDIYGPLFDRRCVMFLEGIVSKTGCKIVISSTWRKDGLSKLRSMWRDRDLPGEVIGVTDVLNMQRGDEIQQYLNEHDDIESYVIIDDDDDMLWE